MLEEWVSIANQRGWIKPTVYQGQYNLLVRVYEKELFPLLRKHGIKFNAFRYLTPSSVDSCGREHTDICFSALLQAAS